MEIINLQAHMYLFLLLSIGMVPILYMACTYPILVEHNVSSL
jgi:hypothetical protein